jgi:hypothetical protein
VIVEHLDKPIITATVSKESAVANQPVYLPRQAVRRGKAGWANTNQRPTVVVDQPAPTPAPTPTTSTAGTTVTGGSTGNAGTGGTTVTTGKGAGKAGK